MTVRRDWRPRDKDDLPPTESAGELERIPRRAGTGTATQQLHLRLVLESKAAEGLRGVLERDGKRVVIQEGAGRLMTAFCTDVSMLDLQNYTGTIRVCSCDAFDED
jgi:hypothetical protein